MLFRLRVLSLVTIASFCSIATAQTKYRATTIPGSFVGFRMNDNHQMAGEDHRPGDVGNTAYWYDGNDVKRIGYHPGSYRSSALDISNSSVIVGIASANNGNDHAMRYSSGFLEDLGTLGGNWSTANAINNAGLIAGTASKLSNSGFEYGVAATFSNGVWTELGSIGGIETWALDINENGQVVGAGNYSGNFGTHAFIYSNGSMTDLGTLGGLGSTATAINNFGVTVGWSGLVNDVFGRRAVRWTGGGIENLGTLGGNWSEAASINSKGQIVGNSRLANNSDLRGFIVNEDGKMVDLSDSLLDMPGMFVIGARQINDDGTILADIGDANYQHVSTAVLTPVPEPASILALTGSLAMLKRRKKAKRQ